MSGFGDDQSWAVRDQCPGRCQKIPRAGSVINHNLRIADGRWYGKSVVLRKEAARNEERARPPSTYNLGDAIPIGNNDGHGSEGYNHLLACKGQVRPNSDTAGLSWKNSRHSPKVMYV